MQRTIQEVMTNDPQTVQSGTSVRAAARQMRDNDIGDVLVMTNGAMSGILTDRDIAVRMVAEGLDPENTSVGEICTPNPSTISSADGISSAVELMTTRSVRRLPVVDDGKLVGVVSLGDLALDVDRASALGEISAAEPNR